MESTETFALRKVSPSYVVYDFDGDEDAGVAEFSELYIPQSEVDDVENPPETISVTVET